MMDAGQKNWDGYRGHPPTSVPLLETDHIRSALMRRVRQRGTPAERSIAKICRELGLRYRLNVKSLPGSPDLANKKERWAIFVHGCFWHRHRACSKATLPKHNAAFWQEKFITNRRRDAANVRALRSFGFRVAIFWECEVNDREGLRSRLQRWPKRLS